MTARRLANDETLIAVAHAKGEVRYAAGELLDVRSTRDGNVITKPTIERFEGEPVFRAYLGNVAILGPIAAHDFDSDL